LSCHPPQAPTYAGPNNLPGAGEQSSYFRIRPALHYTQEQGLLLSRWEGAESLGDLAAYELEVNERLDPLKVIATRRRHLESDLAARTPVDYASPDEPIELMTSNCKKPSCPSTWASSLEVGARSVRLNNRLAGEVRCCLGIHRPRHEEPEQGGDVAIIEHDKEFGALGGPHKDFFVALVHLIHRVPLAGLFVTRLWHRNSDRHLIYNGTTAGPHLVKDINP
jgi:hypothetical protein